MRHTFWPESFQFDFISAERSFTGSKSNKVDARDKADLGHHQVGEFHCSKLELRSHFQHQSIDYQLRSGSTWSTPILTFSGSLYYGCPLEHKTQTWVFFGHPNCMVVFLICGRIVVDQCYNSLVIEGEISSWAKSFQVFYLHCCLTWYLVDYLVKFLNNFQSKDALLITKKPLIDQNIECIVNKVSLLFSG